MFDRSAATPAQVFLFFKTSYSIESVRFLSLDEIKIALFKSDDQIFLSDSQISSFNCFSV